MSATLVEHLKVELSSIPLEQWSGYFPCAVAIWRFMEKARPGTMHLERAGVDERGPYFAGKGVGWFSDVLWPDPEVERLVADIMLTIVTALKAQLRDPRGTDSVPRDKLPAMPVEAIAELEATILDRVDAAVAAGVFA